MTVQSYTIGSLTSTKNNELLDEFHIKRGTQIPNKPSITNSITAPINLPYTFNSSSYTTPSSETYNSTQFQISSAPDFSILERDIFRNKDNFYGPLGGQTDESENIGLGIDIFNLIIGTNQLNNGIHYIRVRHRDESLNWSEWSDIVQFEIQGSINGEPSISIDKPFYNTNENITVNYVNGPGNPKDWIGIYKKGQTPGDIASTTWSYVNGTSGTLTFSVAESGEYYASFFENDGYTELVSERIEFWVGDIPVLSPDKVTYSEGEDVIISYASAPNNAQDWIGVYKMGITPGSGTYSAWEYTSSNNGSMTFSNLPKGYYFATYHLKNDYNEIGERIFFQIGTEITNIATNKNTYLLGESITVSFTDGPGKEKDWLGIYEAGQVPGTDQLYTYKYFGGVSNGTSTIDGTDGASGQPNQIPAQSGDYFIVMFTDDSYNEVSNRVFFDVIDGTLGKDQFMNTTKSINLYPSPVRDYSIIESKHPIEKIELFNITGQKIYEFGSIQKNKFRLEKERLISGTYFLKIHADKVYTMRIIIE